MLNLERRRLDFSSQSGFHEISENTIKINPLDNEQGTSTTNNKNATQNNPPNDLRSINPRDNEQATSTGNMNATQNKPPNDLRSIKSRYDKTRTFLQQFYIKKRGKKDIEIVFPMKKKGPKRDLIKILSFERGRLDFSSQSRFHEILENTIKINPRDNEQETSTGNKMNATQNKPPNDLRSIKSRYDKPRTF